MNEETLLEQPVVTYTVRDMLERIDGKLDRGFQDVHGKLENLSGRVSTLETEATTRQARITDKRYLIATVFSAIVALAALASLIAAVMH